MIDVSVYPSSWESCSVGEAGEAIVGQQRTPEATHGNGLLPYLRVANVHDDALDLNDLASMRFTEVAKERYRLRDGDILLCEGQSRELVGRAALYRGEPEEIYFQNTVIRFRAHDEILPEFALLVFRAYQYSGIFSGIAKATTNIAHLGLTRFKELPFPIPPRATQEEIVDTARSVQSSIDASLSGLASLISTAMRMPSEMRDLVLLGDRAIGEPQSEDPTLPGKWLTAADIVRSDAPIVYGITQPGPEVTDEGGIPYIRGQDLRDGYIATNALRHTSPAIAEKNARAQLATGDVLLGIIRSLRVAIVPEELDGAHITQGTARIRPGEEIDSSYLAHWMRSDAVQAWFRSRLRGINMPRLNLRDVQILPVPVREITEQVRLARILDVATEGLEQVIADANASAKRLRVLERDAVESCAYGAVAWTITNRIEPNRQRELAQLAMSRIKAASTMEDKSPKPRTRNPSNSVPRKKTTQQSGAEQNQVLAVLSQASGPVTPEDLYRNLELEDSAIDSFFVVLRKLSQEGRISISRPNDSDVHIERIR
ncbi:restriction endonuclease subunit S [Streptomyces microflavus]|uniref:restriction endonuclease subunit S n=1 Tax=Streptomyces microflavus TaxID=1919 RepID=UPI003868584E|nr:restriction endonuclease subunit S [Streptomyces microflavus]WST17041.1 restriction endonuclease subunit S [Streptomyces microflavus]